MLGFLKVKIYGQSLATLSALSIVVHLPLVGIVLPGLASTVFLKFMGMATYDVFAANGIIEGIFSFDDASREQLDEQDPIPDQF